MNTAMRALVIAVPIAVCVALIGAASGSPVRTALQENRPVQSYLVRSDGLSDSTAVSRSDTSNSMLDLHSGLK